MEPNALKFTCRTLLLCMFLASQPSAQATTPPTPGQRFRVVVPAKIQTLQTPNRFRLQSSIPIAMITAITKKSGRTQTVTRILHPGDAHFDLAISTASTRSVTMVLTVCPL